MNAETINEYIDHLDMTLHDVNLCNIFNYDETNITDDPGVKKVIVRRGLRRVERKMEHSKQSISIMFCGSATAEYLPPMVVYKAQNVYTGWCEGGPAGAIYDATSTGWFDSRTFEHWFTLIFLNVVACRSGVKAVIGDNLASQFSHNVIQLAKQHNIKFVTLPPNTTYLYQPLDVTVFRSVKRLWKKMLSDLRKESRTKGSVPKSQFPGMLKRLSENLRSENLAAGF